MNNFLCIAKRFSSGRATQRIIKGKTDEPFNVHDTTINGVTQKWTYRSKIVRRNNLDKKHTYIWMAFGILSVFGALSFVSVKRSVIQSRKEEMLMREKLRQEHQLLGEDRKKIGVLNSTYQE